VKNPDFDHEVQNILFYLVKSIILNKKHNQDTLGYSSVFKSKWTKYCLCLHLQPEVSFKKMTYNALKEPPHKFYCSTMETKRKIYNITIVGINEDEKTISIHQVVITWLQNLELRNEYKLFLWIVLFPYYQQLNEPVRHYQTD